MLLQVVRLATVVRMRLIVGQGKKSSFCRQRIRIHVDIDCTQQWLKVVETKESEGCKLIKERQVLLEGERHT